MSSGSSSRASGEAAGQADGLAGGIARLRRALRRGARVADPGNTLAVAQLELLAALAEHPGARPGQLARLLNMQPNTVTTIVNALSARGIVGAENLCHLGKGHAERGWAFGHAPGRSWPQLEVG